MDFLSFDKVSSDNWKTLCKQLRKKHANEGELEVRFEDCLHFILGWPDTNIKRQKTVQSENKNKRADIFLCDNEGKPLIVFEMKKQGWEIKEREIEQLQSYMRPEAIPFGFLVGDKLSLYYDTRESGSKLKRVLSLSFNDASNTDGAMLSSLINYSSFCFDSFDAFYIEYLAEKDAAEARLESKAVIENLANFRKNDTGKDRLIHQLIGLYSEWLEKDLRSNMRENLYIQNLSMNGQWIADHILNSDITVLSDDDFIQRLREFFQKIPNQTRFLNMRLNSDDIILSIRSRFEDAVSHLSNMQHEHRFNALGDFTGNGEFTVKYLGFAFWSEMIRIRFPDVPLFNKKTKTFFDTIGVYIGDTFEEKLKNVSNFYKRFSNDEMDLLKLSHLEHFVVAKNINNDDGREFIKANFPNNQIE